MPLTKAQRALYPSDWKLISARIRTRAGQRCERCKAPNGKSIARGTGDDAGTYMLADGDGTVFDAETGADRGVCRVTEYSFARFIRVVLTVAHLNHVPGDCRPENLAALCQRCHLRYDAEHHAESARATRERKRAERQRSLF